MAVMTKTDIMRSYITMNHIYDRISVEPSGSGTQKQQNQTTTRRTCDDRPSQQVHTPCISGAQLNKRGRV